MDTLERIEVFIRFSILGWLVLFANHTNNYFDRNLKKIFHLLNSKEDYDDYSDSSSIQSSGSTTCSVVSGSVQDSNDYEAELGDNSGSGESVDGPEPPGTPEQESDGEESEPIAT